LEVDSYERPIFTDQFSHHISPFSKGRNSSAQLSRCCKQGKTPLLLMGITKSSGFPTGNFDTNGPAFPSGKNSPTHSLNRDDTARFRRTLFAWDLVLQERNVFRKGAMDLMSSRRIYAHHGRNGETPRAPVVGYDIAGQQYLRKARRDHLTFLQFVSCP